MHGGIRRADDGIHGLFTVDFNEQARVLVEIDNGRGLLMEG